MSDDCINLRMISTTILRENPYLETVITNKNFRYGNIVINAMRKCKHSDDGQCEICSTMLSAYNEHKYQKRFY